MAKKLKEIVIDRTEKTWYVYVDPEYDEAIRNVKGVASIGRATYCLYVTIDPRYDADDLEREIIELCR